MARLVNIIAIATLALLSSPVTAGRETLTDDIQIHGTKPGEKVGDGAKTAAAAADDASTPGAASVEVNPDGTTLETTNSRSDATPETAAPCDDKQPFCRTWANGGGCSRNPEYMSANCPHACGMCSKMGEDDHYYGIRQEVYGDAAGDVMARLGKAKEYMSKLPKAALKNCFYKNKLCGFWAATGECEANWGHMAVDCSPVCETCERIQMLTFTSAADIARGGGAYPGGPEDGVFVES